jgi:outer membrane protein assembly factor BamB/orotate phosphoribosyltransferase
MSTFVPVTVDERERLKAAIKEQVLVYDSPAVRVIAGDETTHVEWLFDFRALLMQPSWLSLYARLFWDRFGDRYPFQVCGMETAAIVLVAAIVMEGVRRGQPVNGFYVRKSRKRQGLVRRIEGTPTADPVIIVDDLINGGVTKLALLTVLEAARLSVTDCYVLLAFRPVSDYEEMSARGVTVSHEFSLPDFGLSDRAGLPRTVSPLHTFAARWKFAAPAPTPNLVVAKSSPCFDESRVYIGSDNGVFYALDRRDGSVVWSFKVGPFRYEKGILSSPLLHQGIVYFGAYDGVVYALDALTGIERWRYDDADWVGSSPALDAETNTLYIGLEFGLWNRKGGIVALDAATGARRWQQFHTALTHCSPLVIPEEDLVVIGSNNNLVYGYNRRTGVARFTTTIPGHAKARFVYDPERRLIYGGSVGGAFFALSASDGSVVQLLACGGMYATPLLVGGKVIFGGMDKTVYCYDPDTWQCCWRYECAGRIFSTPAIGPDVIFAGSNDGRLCEISIAHGVLVGAHQLSERIVGEIRYDSARAEIFVPTVTNELYCLRRALPDTVSNETSETIETF